MNEGAEAPLLGARESGLVPCGAPLVVMLSGGPDSVCLLDVSLRLGATVTALHVNHGLRAESREDERHCRGLCEHLGVALTVEHPGPLEGGNLQAAARRARYEAAERLAGELGADYAAGHTRSDQAETVLYRLATSPGRRSLLGMSPRRERLVRPLLDVSRAETVGYCRARGLSWREDASNDDPRFARARVRHEVMPVLSEIGPAAERTIAETARRLREEQVVLDRAVDDALGEPAVGSVPTDDLLAMPPVLAGLVVRRLFELASDGRGALSAGLMRAVLELGRRSGTASLDVGYGVRAVAEYGVLRFAAAADPARAEPVTLEVPGRTRFGSWAVEVRLAPPGERRPDEAVLRAEALGDRIVVRGWRDGDRMRPAGLGGSKSLQDLFVDSKVPRILRRTLPVVEVEGEIAWVAGVAVGQAFLPREDATGAEAIISARLPEASDDRTLALDA